MVSLSGYGAQWPVSSQRHVQGAFRQSKLGIVGLTEHGPVSTSFGQKVPVRTLLLAGFMALFLNVGSLFSQSQNYKDVINKADSLIQVDDRLKQIKITRKKLSDGGYRYEHGNRAVEMIPSKCCGGIPAFHYYEGGEPVNLRLIEWPKTGLEERGGNPRQLGGGPQFDPKNAPPNVEFFLNNGFKRKGSTPRA